MGYRGAVVRNLLKSWLIFLVPAARGRARVAPRDDRLALLFGGLVFLLGAVLYWYAERIAMGMIGAREVAAGRGAGAARRRRGAVGPRERGPTEAVRVILDAYPRA
jgi:hypothetical protein